MAQQLERARVRDAARDHQSEPATTSGQGLADLSPPVPAVPLRGLAVRRSAGRDELGGSAVDERTEAVLARPSGGRPLADDVRRTMEDGFGADFSAVRVHTGSEAQHAAKAVQATAFTRGNDIFFGRGQAGLDDTHVLAHELTHVVQGQTGRDRGVAAGPAEAGRTMIGRADDGLEQEAEQTAGRVVATLRRHTQHHGCGCGPQAPHEQEAIA